MKKYTREVLKDIVANSSSVSDVCRSLGLRPTGGNIGNMKLRIEEAQLNTDHFLGKGHGKGKQSTTRKPPEEILIKGGFKRNGQILKRALLESGKEHACSKCKQKPFWNNESLCLVVDHINGDCYDHRIENLRLLCPNCHSQTCTFAGKNASRSGQSRKRRLV